MAIATTTLFWIAVWLYGFAFTGYLYGFVFRKERWINRGWLLILGAFHAQTISIAIRWNLTGHFPVQGTYENSMLGAWFIGMLFITLKLWQKKLDIIGLLITPVILMMMGHGVMESAELQPLAPPYKSNWLWFHVFFAWIAYGAFCVAAGLGGMYLLKVWKGDKEILARLPEADIIIETTLKIIMFGFIALTVEVGAGAIWAHGLWGRYWGWDPIETWSLITWLIYGAYIHLGVTMGWRGKRMAWLAIAALAAVFITFGGIGYLGGVHTPILAK